MQSSSSVQPTMLNLPEGSSMDHSGVEIPVDAHFKSAYEQLEAKTERRITEYTAQSHDTSLHAAGSIVQFSERVQKIRSMCIAILRNDPTSFHLRRAEQPQISDRNTCPPHLQKITEAFVKAITQKEQTAVQAFTRGMFDTAYEEFSLVQQALAYEKGSERYFHVQLCLLATLLEQARSIEAARVQEQQKLLQPAKGVKKAQLAEQIETLTSKGEAKTKETIQLLLELQNSRVPFVFSKQHTTLRTAIEDFVREQFAKNEKEFEGIQEQVKKAGRSIDQILSKENLQKGTGLEEYLLGQLEPVQNDLTTCGAEYTKCELRHNVLSTFCSELTLDIPSKCVPVGLLYKKWNDLSQSTITLLCALKDAANDEDKNEALRDWITKNIESYAENELSALHAWALSYLGKLFFSTTLSQDALDDTVSLVRHNAPILFKHFKAFPLDVQLNYKDKHPDMSLLVLATISRFIEKLYCSVDGIANLRRTNVSNLYHSYVPFFGDPTRIKKPQIELDVGIERAVPQIKDPATIIEELISAFQQNNYEPLAIKPTENKVCYFEIASHLLEMPTGIVDLSISPLHTTEFQYQLDAILLLRFAMAREMVFPYDQMRCELEKLTSTQLLEWISLYKPTMIKTNEEMHHTLFFAISATATKLHQGRHKFSDAELAKIFTFLTDLYTDLVRQKVSDSTKNALDTELVQFGCAAVSQARDVGVYHEALALELLTHLDTTAIEAIKEKLLDPARHWLESCVYPRLKTLVLKSGLTSESKLGNLKQCSQVCDLTMPLNTDNSDKDVKALAGAFRQLKTLTLHSGKVAPKHLDMIPLTSLHLNNIQGAIDLSECLQLQKNLKRLSLFDVEVVPGSLAWASSNQNLESLSVFAKQGTPIGCLAKDTLVYGTRQLRELCLFSDCFQDDEDFKLSLPRFIDSHPTLARISLFVPSTESILTYLLTSKKARFIQSLAINLHRRVVSDDELQEYAQRKGFEVDFEDQRQIERLLNTLHTEELKAELERLSEFVALQEFTFHTDDYLAVDTIKAHNFKHCRSLNRCWWVNGRHESSEVRLLRQEASIEDMDN